MMNYQLAVYFCYMLLIGGAAYIIYVQPFDSPNRRIRKLLIMDSIKTGAGKFTAVWQDELLEASLRNAGYPLGLNGVRFQLIRYSLFLVWLTAGCSNWLLGKSPFPVNSFALICLYFVFTMPIRNTPLLMLLEKLSQSHLQVKNKEVFTLYSMIDNEFTSSNGSPVTMYSLLNKLQPNFSSIKPAMGKAILLWRNNPVLALDAFAKEVGTPEAKDLADILKNIHLASPEEALDLLHNRREQFMTMRREIFRRRQKNRGVRDYAITFGASLLVLFNMLVLFYQEYREMMKFLNQH